MPNGQQPPSGGQPASAGQSPQPAAGQVLGGSVPGGAGQWLSADEQSRPGGVPLPPAAAPHPWASAMAAEPRKSRGGLPRVLWTDLRVRRSEIQWQLDGRGQRQLLDDGPYGRVYAARLPRANEARGDNVVVLCLPLPPRAPGRGSARGARVSRELVVRELAILKARCPEFIVSFQGVCVGDEEVQIVAQLAARGELVEDGHFAKEPKGRAVAPPPSLPSMAGGL
jgi:hypothetical protein